MEAEMILLKEVLEDLKADELEMLQLILNKKIINGITIPISKLENMDAVSTARVLCYHHGIDSLKVLRKALHGIPRKDLVEKISKELADEEQKSEDEMDGSPAKKRKLEDLPSYNGKFSLSDMEDYASKNQDQLIRQLQKCLEPAAFETLEKQLAGSKLKHPFSLTSQKYYELHQSRNLKTYLNNIISGKKSQEVPKQILNLLFSARKTKGERGIHKKILDVKNNEDASVESQEEEGIQVTNESKNDDSIPESGTKFTTSSLPESAGEQETKETAKEIKKSLANEEKSSVQVSTKNKVIEPNKRVGKDMVNSIIKKQAKEETDDIPNTVPENELNESYLKVVFRTLKKKCQEEGFDLSSVSHPCIIEITACEHKRYSCLSAQNVLLVKLSEETEYFILRILEDKKDLVKGKRNPKKSVEFELQFNMAILGVRRSELIHDSEFFSRDASSFKEYEEFLEKLVAQVLLPILALYKKARQDIFQKAWVAAYI